MEIDVIRYSQLKLPRALGGIFAAIQRTLHKPIDTLLTPYGQHHLANLIPLYVERIVGPTGPQYYVVGSPLTWARVEAAAERYAHHSFKVLVIVVSVPELQQRVRVLYDTARHELSAATMSAPGTQGLLVELAAQSLKTMPRLQVFKQADSAIQELAHEWACSKRTIQRALASIDGDTKLLIARDLKTQPVEPFFIHQPAKPAPVPVPMPALPTLRELDDDEIPF